MSKLTLKVVKQIGSRNYEFTFEGDNLHDVVMCSKTLSFDDVRACGICGSNDLILSAHVTQEGFEYTYVLCRKCKATLNFGKKKKNENVYYLRTRMIKKQGQIYKVYDWRRPNPVNNNENVNAQNDGNQSNYNQHADRYSMRNRKDDYYNSF